MKATQGQQKPASQSFLLHFAKANFQRRQLTTQSLRLFNKFLDSLNESISKNPALLNEDSVKTMVLVIVFILHNIAEQIHRHTCDYSTLIHFLTSLTEFFEKAQKCARTPQLIRIFQPLLSQSLQQPAIQTILKKIQKIDSIPRPLCKEKQITIQPLAILDSFNGLTPSSNLLKILYVNVLHKSSSQLSQALLLFLQLALQNKNITDFQRMVKVFKHLGESAAVRNGNLHILVNRVLNHTNMFCFFKQLHTLIPLPKLYPAQALLSLLLTVLYRVLAAKDIASEYIPILECLIQLSNGLFSISQPTETRLQTLATTILEWFLCQRKHEVEDTKTFQEFQISMGEKMLDIKKKMQKKLDMIQDNGEFKIISQHITTFILKLVTNTSIRKAMQLPQTFQLQAVHDQASDTLKKFIVNVLPYLIRKSNILEPMKTKLQYSVMAKKIQLACKEDKLFAEAVSTQAYKRLKSQNALNYHYVVVFILFHYQHNKKLIFSRIRQKIDSKLDNLLQETTRPPNNNSILIDLTLLYALEINTNRFVRSKILSILNDPSFLLQKLNLQCFFAIQRNEVFILPQLQKDKHLQEIIAKLNQTLNYFNKDQLTLLYTLVIDFNIITDCQTPAPSLQCISLLRKYSALTEVDALLNILYMEIQRGSSSNKAIVFLILLKINTVHDKIPKDLNHTPFCNMLLQYLFTINSALPIHFLITIHQYRSRWESVDANRFSSVLKEGKPIKFYAMVEEELVNVHILINKLGYSLFRHLNRLPIALEVKRMMLVYGHEENKEETFINNENELVMTSIQLKILLQNPKPTLRTQIIEELKKSPSTTVQTLTQPIDFGLFTTTKDEITRFLTNAVIESFSQNTNSDQAFALVECLITYQRSHGQSNIQDIIRPATEQFLNRSFNHVVVRRMKCGLQKEQGQRTKHLKTSISLYQFVHMISPNNGQCKSFQAMIEEIITSDNYSKIQDSAYILRELSALAIQLTAYSEHLCDMVFDYVMTLLEVYEDQETLQIGDFFCNFFHINAPAKKVQIEESDTGSQVCRNQPNYKCLLCDERQLICGACMSVCHANHPTLYVPVSADIKGAVCECRELAFCRFSLKPKKKQERSNKPIPQFMPHNALIDVSKTIHQGQGIFNSTSVFNNGNNPNNPQFLPSYYGQGRVKKEQYQYRSWRPMNKRRVEQIQQLRMMLAQKRNNGGDQLFFLDSDWQCVDDQYPQQKQMFGQRPWRQFQIQNNYRGFQQQNEWQMGDNPKQPLKTQSDNDSFIEDDYKVVQPMQEQCPASKSQGEQQLKNRAYLLPKFIDGFTKQSVRKESIAASTTLNWKVVYDGPALGKIAGFIWRMLPPKTIHIDVKKQNQINGVSCALVKHTLAQNHKFLFIASGIEILVLSKENMMRGLGATENDLPAKPFLHTQKTSFQVHSVEVSPNDKYMLVAAGLHCVIILTITQNGVLNRTSYKHTVSMFYINKMRLTKLGIFLGLDREICVLNYNCKHVMTITSHVPDTLIKEWCVWERANNSLLVHAVCPNGSLWSVTLTSIDEKVKSFSTHVNDGRKGPRGTGASVLCKSVPHFGTYVVAAFKEGGNILGRMEQDQLHDVTYLNFKIGLDPLLDACPILGFTQLLSPNASEMLLVATLKKPLMQEMAFNQGVLVLVRFANNQKTKVQIMPQKSSCEYFTVMEINEEKIVCSVHQDGSVHVFALTQPSLADIEAQVEKIKKADTVPQPLVVTETVNYAAQRKSILNEISLDSLGTNRTNREFRENSELLKVNKDYTLKQNGDNIVVRMLTNERVISGVSLPYSGTVQILQREINCCLEVGLSAMESLYIFANGIISFNYIKDKQLKFSREDRGKFLQKIDQNESKRSNEVHIYGKTLQSLKCKIPKFDQYFQQQKPNSLQSMCLLFHIFLSSCIRNSNFACQSSDLIDLAQILSRATANAPKSMYSLLKDNIKMCIRLVEMMEGRPRHVFNDPCHGPRLATEARITQVYKSLKRDPSQSSIQFIFEELEQLLKEEFDLIAYYLALYPSLLVFLEKRMKKETNIAYHCLMIRLYCMGYCVEKTVLGNSQWIMQAICASLIHKDRTTVRKELFSCLQMSTKWKVNMWVCNVKPIDEEGAIAQPIPEKVAVREDSHPLFHYYDLYSRGQIDDDTLFKIVQETSEMDQLRRQQAEKVQFQMIEEPQQQQNMPKEDSNNNTSFLQDFITHCTSYPQDTMQNCLCKITGLYVAGRVSDCLTEQDKDYIALILQRIKDILLMTEVKQHVTMGYLFVASNIVSTSAYFKRLGHENIPSYVALRGEVMGLLRNIDLEGAEVMKNPPSLLPYILRGKSLPNNIHFAYALTSVLVGPCEPDRSLLRLGCYWLLPHPIEHYSRLKTITQIKEGVETDNLNKVYELAQTHPNIWKETDHSVLDWLDKCIDGKTNEWPIALELLAIYYE